MKVKYLLSLTVAIVLLSGASAFAAKPFQPFESQSIKSVPESFKAWHNQYEKDGDYGESWFTMVQTKDNGVLFAMLTITNLGLKTFDGIVDAQFYTPDGKIHHYHKEVNRKKVRAATDKMDARVDRTRTWYDAGKKMYYFVIDDKDWSMKLGFRNVLPSAMFGNGTMKFYQDKSAEWALGINVPYGRSSGKITLEGKTYSLSGNVYSDHGWATIKMPDFVREWRTVRVYNDKKALVLHQQFLTKTFGGAEHAFGLFSIDGKTMLPLSEISLKPSATSKFKTGYNRPTAYDFSAKAGSYKISGTIKESRFLEAIDVLGQVSWPVRVLIKAFYANPYMFRYLTTYDFLVTEPGGTSESLKGKAVVESNPF